MKQHDLKNSPQLPRLFRLPVKFLPEFIRHGAFIRALNGLFGQELKDDELDFMQGRSACIKISDAQLVFAFSVQGKRFVAADTAQQADLVITGTLYDFLLLISRREDPDTLFFNRRLKLSGDTELGLYVKNFLDSVDMTERFRWLQNMSVRASMLAEKFPATIR